jgi:hypothetical protein
MAATCNVWLTILPAESFAEPEGGREMTEQTEITEQTEAELKLV